MTFRWCFDLPGSMEMTIDSHFEHLFMKKIWLREDWIWQDVNLQTLEPSVYPGLIELDPA